MRHDYGSAWTMSPEKLRDILSRVGPGDPYRDSSWFSGRMGASGVDGIYYGGAAIARMTPGKVEEMPFKEGARLVFKGESAESELVGMQRCHYILRYEPEAKERPWSEWGPIIKVISRDKPLVVRNVFYVNVVGCGPKRQFMLEFNLPEEWGGDYILLFQPRDFIAAESVVVPTAA